jgi:hypothetical protein
MPGTAESRRQPGRLTSELVRGSGHAGDRRAGSGLGDARDREAVTLVERDRSRVGGLEERRQMIRIDDRQSSINAETRVAITLG